jgi:2-dehydro-3-deoxygalactonokinase
MPQPVLIAADWGSTNFRLYLLDEAGQICAAKTAPIGLKMLGHGRFDTALAGQLDDQFADPALPILICGMAGAKGGWVETAYVDAPAGLGALADGLCCVPQERLGDLAGRRVYIVPGMACKAQNGLYDVMRGEETQAFGLMAQVPDLKDRLIMPGTHCKWIRVNKGRIEEFRTYMTGEVHHLLLTHSLLAAQDQHEDLAAFDRGFGRGFADPALLSLVFSGRTERLFGRLDDQSVASYVSGLLIGHEIACEQRHYAITQAHLVGADGLCALYARGLRSVGVEDIRLHDSNLITARGLFELYRASSLYPKV